MHLTNSLREFPAISGSAGQESALKGQVLLGLRDLYVCSCAWFSRCCLLVLLRADWVMALDRTGVNPRGSLLLERVWGQKVLAWSQSWRSQKLWPWWPCCCTCGMWCREQACWKKNNMHCCGLKVKLASFFFFRWNPGRGEYHRQTGAENILLYCYLGYLAGPSPNFATYGWALHSQLILHFNLLPIETGNEL